jgi:membrane protease YdiL (CAAX protease family)
VFLLMAFGIGWPLLVVPAVTGLPFEPFLLGLVFLALLGSSLLVSRWADGPGAVRRLLSRTLLWRFGIGRWAVIVLGVPVLTLLLAAATGTLEAAGRSWFAAVGWYLFDILVFGALVLNLWEETAWGGFAQTRLMARHGLLVGSLLTAPLFAAIHIPLQFGNGWTWSQVLVGLAVLFGVAPFYRYLLGMHLLDTRGSILAIAVQHASWNTAGRLDEVRGEWQAIAAVGLLTALVALHRRFWRPGSRPIGRDAEKAVAAQWFGAPERVGS